MKSWQVNWRDEKWDEGGPENIFQGGGGEWGRQKIKVAQNGFKHIWFWKF